MVLQGELSYVIRVLQSCPLTPGFIDVYSESHNISEHGQRLLNYIVRNRANTSMLPISVLSAYQNIHNMRTVALKHIFDKIAEGSAQGCTDVTEKSNDSKPITKCYTYIEVSTNKEDVGNLTNGESSSYWQSDGSARSHWIRYMYS